MIDRVGLGQKGKTDAIEARYQRPAVVFMGSGFINVRDRVGLSDGCSLVLIDLLHSYSLSFLPHQNESGAMSRL